MRALMRRAIDGNERGRGEDFGAWRRPDVTCADAALGGSGTAAGTAPAHPMPAHQAALIRPFPSGDPRPNPAPERAESDSAEPAEAGDRERGTRHFYGTIVWELRRAPRLSALLADRKSVG